MKKFPFYLKTGKVSLPMASKITPDREPVTYEIVKGVEIKRYGPSDMSFYYPYKICNTFLREGCYSITISSKPFPFVSNVWNGTIRVEHADDGLCISGDLYKINRFLLRKNIRAGKPISEMQKAFYRNYDNLIYPNKEFLGHLTRKKGIPVFPRKSYYAYLLGTSATLLTIVKSKQPCRFSLGFNLYEFEHEVDGYEGTFPASATKSVSLELVHTTQDDKYTGNMYSGPTLLGSVTIERVSSYFRKAYLDVHTLQGAVAPQPVEDPDGTGDEDFRTIFATAGWDLRVSYKSPDLTMPPSLAGIQDADDCWSRANSHALLETASTHDPAELDKKWKVHLLAIEGRLGCSRGRMFDNELDAGDIGDVNDVAREGAVTYCEDGYDSPAFGDNENDLQKNLPRAFIRSAAHEIGHAFNLIHQFYEYGNDNSIMTTSPSVANVLNTAGLDFPEDIDLSFNDTCRHHLIHLPDPAVRPGAIAFFGNLIVSPEADDVFFYDSSELELVLKVSNKKLKLGEMLQISWRVVNNSKYDIALPKSVSDSSFTARISITYPDGSIRYIRPTEINADLENPIIPLKPGESRDAESILFWNKKGFVFKNPGNHGVEVILLWIDEGCYAGVRASVDVWVDYPVTVADNEVASLMLDKSVGRFIATKGRAPIKDAISRIEKVFSKYKTHPASAILKNIPGHRFSKVKTPTTRKRIKLGKK